MAAHVVEGSFETKKQHALNTAIVDAAISDYEAIATKFAASAIKDGRTRENYMNHIKRVSREVRDEVNAGKISVKEGAEFCNQLRDKLFIEYRKYTSAIGVARAEEIKLDSKGVDYYLNKYSKSQFGKAFADLNEAEKNKIYYAVLESSGRSNAAVSAEAARLRVLGKVGVLMTAALATYQVVRADRKIKEAARQGSIIAGGMLGGGIAGLGASVVCGPAAPVCVIALVALGSSLGGMAGDALNDAYQQELEEFARWNSR
jgi:hypothetical protein